MSHKPRVGDFYKWTGDHTWFDTNECGYNLLDEILMVFEVGVDSTTLRCWSVGGFIDGKWLSFHFTGDFIKLVSWGFFTYLGNDNVSTKPITHKKNTTNETCHMCGQPTVSLMGWGRARYCPRCEK